MAVILGGLAAGIPAAGCASAAREPTVASVGHGTPSAGDAVAQLRRYRDCLLSSGLTLLDEPTAEGLPQIDKAHNSVDRIAAGTRACAPLLPATTDAERVDPGAVAAQQRLARCLRENGVPDYPDPDPITGQPALSDELATRLKEDPALARAVETCRARSGVDGPGGKVGG